MKALTPEDLASREVRASQRREWMVERAAWVVIALVLLAGLAGALGDGPLARASRTGGSMKLEYDRIVRRNAPTELRLQLTRDVLAGGTFEILLGGPLLDRATLVSIRPTPVLTRQADDKFRFQFSIPGGSRQSRVVFQVQPTRAGATGGTLEVAGSDPVAFSQFVLP